jgi:hypothetical protein
VDDQVLRTDATPILLGTSVQRLWIAYANMSSADMSITKERSMTLSFELQAECRWMN